MSSLAFDTHRAVKSLQEAGAEESLAEAVVATIGVAMGENMASKADIGELKADISGLRTELKADIGGLRTELKADISGLRAELKADISGLRAELKADIKDMATKADISDLRTELKADIKDMATKDDLGVLKKEMIIQLGGIMVVSVGTVAALVSLI